jgi:hypothetical protein
MTNLTTEKPSWQMLEQATDPTALTGHPHSPDKHTCIDFYYQGDEGDIFYPIAGKSLRVVRPRFSPQVPGIFSIERMVLNKEGDYVPVDLTDSIPDFDPQTGGFNVNNPELYPGIRYWIRFQPSEDQLKNRAFLASFLVQGLYYRPGVHRLKDTTALAPTYNGDGTPLPDYLIGLTYSFVLKDAKGEKLAQGNNQGDCDNPNAPVFGQDSPQLNLRRLSQFFDPKTKPTNVKPIELNLAYKFIDSKHTVSVKQQLLEVYYFNNTKDIPADLLDRAKALAVFQTRTRDLYGHRPPIIILVDAI